MARSFADKVFFCNSGAEANEAAIKIARLYGHGRNIDRPAIIVMETSFHGRTRELAGLHELLVAGDTLVTVLTADAQGRPASPRVRCWRWARASR